MYNNNTQQAGRQHNTHTDGWQVGGCTMPLATSLLPIATSVGCHSYLVEGSDGRRGYEDNKWGKFSSSQHLESLES